MVKTTDALSFDLVPGHVAIVLIAALETAGADPGASEKRGVQRTDSKLDRAAVIRCHVASSPWGGRRW